MYRLYLLRSARKELDRLHPANSRRLYEAIQALATKPRPPKVKKLEGGKGWRIRVGDHRIVYTIDDVAQEIAIVKVGHRRDVYRGL